MEHDFLTLWRALAPGDLPGPVSEFRFHPVRRWRFDFAWPASERGGLAVEIDGGQWRAGGGRHNTDGDRLKLNTAAALGWRVLRFSHTALETDPAGCVELVAGALILGAGGAGAEFAGPSGPLPGAIRGTSGRDPGGNGDAGGGDRRGDPAPTAPENETRRTETPQLKRRESLKLQRPQRLQLTGRPALKLQRRETVKLTKRAGDPPGGGPDKAP